MSAMQCKYGDPFCPCQDANICHYEGENPMPPPLTAPKCPYCAAAIPRWWHAGQYWHRIQYIQPTPVEGAKPITIPSLGDVPDRFACKET